MRSMRVALPRPVPAACWGEFLGLNEEETTPGRLLAVESYEGMSPTFTWMADTGHIFNFLPPHAFGQRFSSLDSCVDMACAPGAIDVSDLGLEGPGWARVGHRETNWKKYHATVDWYEDNRLCHLVSTHSGEFLFVRNPRFQVGGDKLDLPAWKKLRQTWDLPKA